MSGIAAGKRNKVGLRLCSLLMLMLLTGFTGSAAAMEDDEEISLLEAVRTPYVYIVSPQPGATYTNATELAVKVGGRHVEAFELELATKDTTLRYAAEGSELEHLFVFDSPQTGPATLVVRGYADASKATGTPSTEISMEIVSPKAELVEKMIALAYDNSKDSKYKFAPAEEDWHIGVCKNFVMRLFDTYSQGYRMLEYPELAMHMPVNNSKKACAPYDYGIEWKPETAAEGSPFEIVAQFKYNDNLTKDENAELARALLVQIQKGDFFQIVGYYGGGNGPHSMYIIQDYNPETEMIHWTDSNMRGTRVDGVRWGYLQFDADAEVDWWIEVFNMKKRGATLYRLRDDLFVWN